MFLRLFTRICVFDSMQIIVHFHTFRILLDMGLEFIKPIGLYFGTIQNENLGFMHYEDMFILFSCRVLCESTYYIYYMKNKVIHCCIHSRGIIKTV